MVFAILVVTSSVILPQNEVLKLNGTIIEPRQSICANTLSKRNHCVEPHLHVKSIIIQILEHVIFVAFTAFHYLLLMKPQTMIKVVLGMLSITIFKSWTSTKVSI